ncbi:hypothetical protein N7468_000224 [Penicillium chermesinum]|uniref:Short-chain dehydrogenase n=1 Tax=Penicillium chermesinum TaxID=63820 RepID=A0A9W9PJU5_9EURO|nr:uncharacterized protein N7468_000224 [Penicillium chermesinum]KAJ5248773.1 hypothetical protein N7468_000224 [Penicillium chermesinum]KAJ6150877.1 hypothetical protein N7470_007471 [Penicillium chermesinum]
MSQSPVIFILGAGPNIGQSVANEFASKGYRVALAARKLKEEDSTAQELHLPIDLSKPSAIAAAFAKVKEQLGAPSVVVYNASAAGRDDPQNPLSLSLEDFSRDLSINTISVYAAAQEAVACFETLPSSASKTFIYTGNILNTRTIKPMMSLGTGKSATAHFLEYAASSYAERRMKFYYADERRADGSPAYFDIDGDSHAKFYFQLSQSKSQGQWHQTFVKEQGYHRF